MGLIYTISEFAKAIGISEHTLRYYEKEGLIEPSRNEHNYRIYDEADIEWATFVIKLKKLAFLYRQSKPTRN
ncbi:MerR family transcriptional regulator [Enterococcus termitis]